MTWITQELRTLVGMVMRITASPTKAEGPNKLTCRVLVFARVFSSGNLQHAVWGQFCPSFCLVLAVVLVHCCYTVVTLLLHCCFTFVTLLTTLLSQFCYTVVTLLWHFCDTFASLLWHCYDTVVTLLWHCCDTVVTLLWHCRHAVVALFLKCSYIVVVPISRTQRWSGMAPTRYCARTFGVCSLVCNSVY
jgi:hypothetical protein